MNRAMYYAPEPRGEFEQIPVWEVRWLDADGVLQDSEEHATLKAAEAVRAEWDAEVAARLAAGHEDDPITCEIVQGYREDWVPRARRAA